MNQIAVNNGYQIDIIREILQSLSHKQTIEAVGTMLRITTFYIEL